MLNVDGRLYAKVLFDGKELPIEHCSIEHIQLNSHEKMGVPMGEILLGDPNNFFKNTIKLLQGMPVTLYLGQTSKKFKTYNMSLFSFKEHEIETTVVYHIYLVHQKHKYLRETTQKPFKGTSTDALKDIATKVGLTYKGSPTTDAQVWLPGNKTYFKWAIDISKKGYVDDKSCMMVGVTLQGEMRYANITDINKDKIKSAKTFLYGVPGNETTTYMVWGKRFIDRSGIAHSQGGAKTTTYEQNTQKPNAKHDKVKLVKKARNTSFNKHNDKIEQGKVNYAPIDGGNGHTKVVDALHQNARLKLLQTNKFQLICFSACDVDLFDVVNFQIKDNKGGQSEAVVDKEKSGYYVVTGKTVFVSSSAMYCEKYDIIREGNNKDR